MARGASSPGLLREARLTLRTGGATLCPVRHFGLLLLVLANTALSEPSRRPSPVHAALARVSGTTSAGATLESLASGIPDERRPQAKSTLDAIDRARLSFDEFGELCRAYVLLGFSDAAGSAGDGFAEDDPRRAWGLSQAASAAAGRSEYGEAIRLANEALRLKPGDPVASATLRLAQGRGRTAVGPSAGGVSQESKVSGVESVQPATQQPPLVMSAPAKRRSLSDSSIPSLQMLDDEAAAPEATLPDRVKSFITPDQQLVEQDLKKMRELLAGFELPDGIASLGSTNPDAPKGFVPWLRSVPDSELAPIAYGIIDAGLLGEYSPSAFGRGTITLNHFIRGAEKESRATVLLHEVYHYWDWKVAGNPYPKAPYGLHHPEAIARREYDAYYVAMFFWKHARPADAASPTARALDRIPSDTEVLMRQVDEAVLRRKDR